MNKLEEAIILATARHQGIKDENGDPYILHPLRVMLDLHRDGFDGDVLAAAVMHDLVEDTEVTLDEIRGSFGDTTADLVDALTQRKGEESYKEYIDRVAYRSRTLFAAVFIKLADLRDNMSPWRITNKSGLYTRYAKAYYRLTHGRWPGEEK